MHLAKNKQPQISVIIPAHNRAWALPAAIASVREQTFENFELIVVDDGSVDNTRELVGHYPDIRYLGLESNQGVSVARNRGMELARGRYLCFLDSDDTWISTKLERQWNWMQANPESVACYTDEIWIRNGVRVNPRNKHRKYSGNVFRECLPLCIISPSSIMMCRETLEALGGFDENMVACEDYELWLLLAADHEVHCIDEKLIVKYGGHDDQLSKRYWGMDRFRVYALDKLLRHHSLSPGQQREVLNMLVEKCVILETGYRNRGKKDEAEQYASAAKHYRTVLASPDRLSVLPTLKEEILLAV